MLKRIREDREKGNKWRERECAREEEIEIEGKEGERGREGK